MKNWLRILLLLVLLYFGWTLLIRPRPIRAQADADQARLPGLSLASDVSA